MMESVYNPHFRLVLASNSPRRKQILSDLGVCFTTFPAEVEETLPNNISPRQGVALLALRKALAGGRAFLRSHPETKGFALGADTLVCFGNTLLGKPASPKDARAMLRSLSGTTHTVYTGIFLADLETIAQRSSQEEPREIAFLPSAAKGTSQSTAFFVPVGNTPCGNAPCGDFRYGKGAVVASQVTFRTIDPQEIEASIAAKEPFDKAGGYGIQGRGSLWATSITGDYFNIVGLPLCALDALCVDLTCEHLTELFQAREE